MITVKTCVASLTRLDLPLWVDPHDYDLPDLNQAISNAAEMIQAASNLTHLRILLDVDSALEEARLFFEILTGLPSPNRIKNLHLHGFSSTATQLTELLGRSDKLHCVTLEDWTLISGTWASVVQEMRENLPLRRAEILGPGGGYPETQMELKQ